MARSLLHHPPAVDGGHQARLAPLPALSWEPLNRWVGMLLFAQARHLGIVRLRLEDGSEVISLDGLTKAGPRGGKYVRRIPGRRDPVTGRMRWRYFYANDLHARIAAAADPTSGPEARDVLNFAYDPPPDPRTSPEGDRGWLDWKQRDERVLRALQRAKNLKQIENALSRGGFRHREFGVFVGDGERILKVSAGPLTPRAQADHPRLALGAIDVSVWLQRIPQGTRALTLTHNHGSLTPPSAADMLTAINNRIREVRVVNETGVWSVKLSKIPKLYPFEREEMKGALEELRAVSGLVARQAMPKGSVVDLTLPDGDSAAQVKQEFVDEWNQRFAGNLRETWGEAFVRYGAPCAIQYTPGADRLDTRPSGRSGRDASGVLRVGLGRGKKDKRPQSARLLSQRVSGPRRARPSKLKKASPQEPAVRTVTSAPLTWVELSPRLGRALWVTSLLKGGRHRAVSGSRVMELPREIVALLDPSILEKAAAKGGKYIKRVPTGKFRTTKSGKPGAPIYKYYYRVSGVADKAHFQEGASFKHGAGQYTIHDVKNGKLSVTHTHTGAQHELTHDELANMLHQEHGAAIKKEHATRSARLQREIAAARQNNATPKQIARLLDEARRFGVKLPDDKPSRSKTSSNKKIESVGDVVLDGDKKKAKARAPAVVAATLLLKPFSLEDARASGVSPGAAHMLLSLRNRISAKSDSTQEGRAAYIDDVRVVQEAMARVKTLDDFRGLLRNLIAHHRSAHRSEHVAEASSEAEADSIVAELHKTNPQMLYVIYPHLIDKGASIRAFRKLPLDELGKNFAAFTGLETHRNQVFLKAWGEAKRLDAMSSDKAWKLLEKQTSITNPVTITPPQKPTITKNTNVAAVRTGGEPVTDANPQRLKDTFNLREVDYRSTMTRAEREYHTKQLEGALHDLSDALGIEPELVSFRGRLGVAMGARGKGKAAAHYEAERGVIHLTHFTEGESLAHEWGRAFSNIVANNLLGKKDAHIGLSGLPRRHDAVPKKLMSLITNLKWSIEGYPGAPAPSKFVAASSLRGKAGEQELFARAFETYVHDKLREIRRTNTYLVTSGINASDIHPQKQERNRVHLAFQRLFAYIHSHKALMKASLGIVAARKLTLLSASSP